MFHLTNHVRHLRGISERLPSNEDEYRSDKEDGSKTPEEVVEVSLEPLGLGRRGGISAVLLYFPHDLLG